MRTSLFLGCVCASLFAAACTPIAAETDGEESAASSELSLGGGLVQRTIRLTAASPRYTYEYVCASDYSGHDCAEMVDYQFSAASLTIAEALPLEADDDRLVQTLAEETTTGCDLRSWGHGCVTRHLGYAHDKQGGPYLAESGGVTSLRLRGLTGQWLEVPNGRYEVTLTRGRFLGPDDVVELTMRHDSYPIQSVEDR